MMGQSTVSNSVSASFKEFWSRTMQRKHFKNDVFRAIASFREEEVLKKGDTVNRPYRSKIVTQDYTRGTAFTVQDLTDTNEQLLVQTAKIAPFYVDDLDELQSDYGIAANYAEDAAVSLGNVIDGDVLGEYDQTNLVVEDDDMNVGGTDGVGFTVNTGNIQKMFAVAKKKLKRKSANDQLFAVISPDVEQVLMEYLAGKESQLGDSTGMNGNIGKYYGFDLYVSNSLGWSAVLYMATLPTNTDTVTLKIADPETAETTITFTFVSSIGSTAGNVLIDGGSSVDTTRASLAALINAPGTTNSTQVALSAAHQALLKGVTATNSNSADTLTLKGEGKSFIVVGETLTAAADIWTANTQIQHNLFGRKGCIDVVIQKKPNVEFKDVPDKLGKNVAPWTLYGLKTFNDGKDEFVDVKVRSDAFVN